MNALRTSLLLILANPLAARATSYVPVDVKEALKGAQVIAHIEVTSDVPEKTIPGYNISCGATVTARVVESFKGTETGRTIRFAGGLEVGSQYLVALYKFDPYAKDDVTIEIDGMSSQEAERMTIACKKKLPELQADWRVLSEFVSSQWVTWGYRINPPAGDAGLTFVGRKAQNTIESLSYVGKELVVASTTQVSLDHPDYGPIVASTFSFPRLYVEWATYRNFLLKAFK